MSDQKKLTDGAGADGIQVLSGSGSLPGLPEVVLRANRFASDYSDLYLRMVNEALAEFPATPGYETMHKMLIERSVFFFVFLKESDSRLATDIDWKVYRGNMVQFLKTCEALIKEAKNISVERTYKNKLVQEVVGIIDRHVHDRRVKESIARELMNIHIE
jgi:hypothetical protein